ncbi:MAG: bifunctional UDP-N-acetylglucosamine diphosphorylase/glucosamine-1-phosphate N-acetyltransferase GlmU [Bdellovibrionales bacterium]|nr:bifunctional UDP-N-acetylglucosamine diphosphorylase/glucosamine-1-phosphate N-acetyltransferase GlmU [Bdellovibrionales bacterium]
MKKNESRRFQVIILAAGQGTRMKSHLPKVLHPVAGMPMIQRVVEAVKIAGASEVRVVLGHHKELVESFVSHMGVSTFLQKSQLGTADAVKAADIESLDGDVMILNGDHPLLRAEDILGFLSEFHKLEAKIAFVSTSLDRPGSYGRVVRSQGQVKAIVEAKDASAQTLEIKEINTGIYVLTSELLQKLLPRIQPLNAQKEFYLTDLVQLANDEGITVHALTGQGHVAFGVNTQSELSEASRILFRAKCEQLMSQGVMILDPNHTYIEDRVEVGQGTMIYPNCFIKGKTKIGKMCIVEAGCWIEQSTIADGSTLRAYSHLADSRVGGKALIGPFARLRPGTDVGDEAHVGNFVELKKVKFGKGAKANHLTYLGDAEIGEGTNIGCGTITCNYAVDRKKYVTKIGKNAFIGSDTQFIAPVTIGDNAVIGSGSTITKDVPANALGVARAKQLIKENYVSIEEDDVEDTL